jgi:uncharacterized membrane protein
MKKVMFFIPIMTLFADVAILLDIPIFREVIVFVFLSFVPGYATLKLFKLKKISFLDTVLFSVAVSVAFIMFAGLLVNELYLFLGFSRPLSTFPLIGAISAFTLAIFLIDCMRDMPETHKLKMNFEGNLKNVIPLSIIIFILPFLSALGVLYLNIYLILLSCAIIASLCVLSVVSRRFVPENLFPFLIISISIALACQIPLISKYIIGWDVNLEYYVFRVTQINGHWGFLDTNVNPIGTLTYNSMLSITLLPAVYSVLMNAQGEITFKILYPFLFSLVPLTIYRICDEQFGKLIGLLSALFFTFTSASFFGAESLSLNRQIVGELFLVLAILVLVTKTIPVTKRRLLLIILGAALAVSHYTLGYIFLAIVTLVFIGSRVMHQRDEVLNALTIFLLFVITFSWDSIGTFAPVASVADAFKLAVNELTQPSSATVAVAASSVYGVPSVFTMASWINIAVLGLTNLFLIIGILVVILRPKVFGVFKRYSLISVVVAFILALSLLFPSIAAVLNFSRVLGICLLFLSPCFVLGGQALLKTLWKIWLKIRQSPKGQSVFKIGNVSVMFLLIAIVLGAYFLSQVGFVNRVANGNLVGYYNIAFDKMLASNESQIKLSLYYSYIPERDVFGASWLSSHRVNTTSVFADQLSESHVLLSYGLVPKNLMYPIDNTTISVKGSLVYLGSLNTVNGIITTSTAEFFNTSEISSVFDQNNLIYSNGNCDVWYVTPFN